MLRTEQEEKELDKKEEMRMKHAQHFARMLMRTGQAEEELAVYIEYAWQESPEYMADDLKILEKFNKRASNVNHSLNNWAYARWEGRE